MYTTVIQAVQFSSRSSVISLMLRCERTFFLMWSVSHFCEILYLSIRVSYELLDVVTDINSSSASTDAFHRDAGIFQGPEGALKEQFVLRVHDIRLRLGNTKKIVVKLVQPEMDTGSYHLMISSCANIICTFGQS